MKFVVIVFVDKYLCSTCRTLSFIFLTPFETEMSYFKTCSSLNLIFE